MYNIFLFKKSFIEAVTASRYSSITRAWRTCLENVTLCLPHITFYMSLEYLSNNYMLEGPYQKIIQILVKVFIDYSTIQIFRSQIYIMMKHE